MLPPIGLLVSLAKLIPYRKIKKKIGREGEDEDRKRRKGEDEKRMDRQGE
jgi:hypothetical protein